MTDEFINSPLGIRLNRETQRKLNVLRKKLKLKTKTSVIRYAIHELYRQCILNETDFNNGFIEKERIEKEYKKDGKIYISYKNNREE